MTHPYRTAAPLPEPARPSWWRRLRCRFGFHCDTQVPPPPADASREDWDAFATLLMRGIPFVRHCCEPGLYTRGFNGVGEVITFWGRLTPMARRELLARLPTGG